MTLSEPHGVKRVASRAARRGHKIAAMTALRLATWNINSLRLRLQLLERLVDALDPDVICLQETKVPDELFPDHGPPALGYPHVVRRGMKGYNGVAILSRIPLLPDDTAPDWCDKGDCRHLQASSCCRPARWSCTTSTSRPAATCRTRGQPQVRPQAAVRGAGAGLVRRPPPGCAAPCWWAT